MRRRKSYIKPERDYVRLVNNLGCAIFLGFPLTLFIGPIILLWYVISIPYGEPASDAEMMAFLEEHRSELNILVAAVDGDHIPLPVIEDLLWHNAEYDGAASDYPVFYAAYTHFRGLELAEVEIENIDMGKNSIYIKFQDSEWKYPYHGKKLLYESNATRMKWWNFTEMDTNEYMEVHPDLMGEGVDGFTIYKSLGDGWYIEHAIIKYPYDIP